MTVVARRRGERRAAAADRVATGLRVNQWLGFTIGLLLVLAVVGIGLALAADSRLSDRRKALLDRIGPARVASFDLASALINQETGIRGYVIDPQQQFLQPYRQGLAAEAADYRQLQALLTGDEARFLPHVRMVQQLAAEWRRDYVAPVLAGMKGTPALDSLGKQRFDAIRAAQGRLQTALNANGAAARSSLYGASRTLTITLVVVGGLIILGLLAAAVLLRRIVTGPLAALGQEVRRVIAGEFRTPLGELSGAREIVETRDHVEAMRELIVGELSEVTEAREQLATQAVELQRSNAELEQFAYVASHDLQEPLRKVASFCQALERRYRGQLDDRANQYIDFAVDGAKRMQVLINDLLAFSRVGRSDSSREPLAVADLVAEGEASLSSALEEAGAGVETSDLPEVVGNRALLVSVFQNLIGNAVKFRSAEPPRIRIEAHAEDGFWHFSATDNGIGIGPEYAERVFEIFQRLHSREAYPGTGIGLAMCRKIIEYHGGRIWVDTEYAAGARVRFTLPVMESPTTTEPVRT